MASFVGRLGGQGSALTETVFAGRYQLGPLIGQGGMADVYEARDLSRGCQVALKRLRPRPVADDDGHSRLLFEREFHVLSELSHPRVVTAHDYGVADDQPYYTMELLDGGDLHKLSPLPFERVCAVFRDVCSVLSLLHSRRLVYRDLNVRNVRCTAAGEAKLIDFGAMMPMGSARKLIGTPGFVAPEIVHQQTIDGRADLYALGCAMYYAIAGRPPYVARDFAQLRLLWSTPLTPPSRLGISIPAALEDLLMDLLQQDPGLRPGTAAEVMDRLSAIAHLQEDDVLVVSGAYLATPPLIGRGEVLSRIAKHLSEAQAGAGRTVLLDAVGGAGRSRVLDASVLEGKRRGILVARADAVDAQRGDFGGARVLLGQLMDAMPEAMVLAEAHAEALGHVIPQVHRSYPEIPLLAFSDPRERRPRILAALRAWIRSMSERRPVILAVDDVHRLDEPSLALLALLSAEQQPSALCLLLTQERGAEATSETAKNVLRDHAHAVGIDPLDQGDAQDLVAAMFGDGPRVALLSARIYASAGGKPRDILTLAQHLLSQGIIRFQRGQFLLPAVIDAAHMPSNVEEAGRGVVAALSSTAQALGRALGLCEGNGLAFEDCLQLFSEDEQVRVFRALSELCTADLVRVVDGIYLLSRPAWGEAFCAELEPEQAAEMHRRLAAMIRRRGHNPLRHIRHLQLAHDDSAALDAMVTFCKASTDLTDNSPDAFHELVESLPPDWYALFDWAVEATRQAERPARELYAVLHRFSGLLGLDPRNPSTHMRALVEQLRHASGLDLYEALGSETEPGDRLKVALETAQARYDAALDHEQTLSPLAALRPLARTEIAAASVIVNGFDYPLLNSLPSLAALEVFSPALGVVALLMQGLSHRMAARGELARQTYHRLLHRIEQPDRGGLDETHACYARVGVLHGLLMIEVTMGLPLALEGAGQLEDLPLMRPQGNAIRMLHHYFHGQPEAGDALKRDQALLRIESSPLQWFDGSQLLPEVIAHVLGHDLTRLSNLLPDLEARADKHAGWRPLLMYARSEYHRLRGDLGEAERTLESLLGKIGAGDHQIWPNAAGARIAVLVALGRSGDAVRCGSAYLRSAQACELGDASLFIKAALAVAFAREGDCLTARHGVDELLHGLNERGVGGLLLGMVYEASASVALLQRDGERTEADLERCLELFRASENPNGHARCDRIRRALHTLRTEADGQEAALPLSRHWELQSQIDRRLLQARGDGAVAEGALQWLLRAGAASTGALFALQAGAELSVCAACGITVDDALLASVHQRWQALTAIDVADDLCTQTEMGDAPAVEVLSRELRPVVLCHGEGGTLHVTGLALLREAAPLSSAAVQALSRALLRHGFQSIALYTIPGA